MGAGAGARAVAGTRYVALLRAVNVGGNNLVPMAQLRAAFEDLGLDDVSTYIASGNVMFTGAGADLERRIEAGLSKRFGYDARVVLRSKARFAKTVASAPASWRRGDDRRRNVIFLKDGLTPKSVMAAIPSKPEVDEVAAGPGCVYVATPMDLRTQSGLPRFMGTPQYKQTTIRTFGTCERILALL